MCDIVPAEVPADHPLVRLTLAAGADARPAGQGRRPRLVARRGRLHPRDGTPTFSFGPPGGLDKAHAVDESVPVDDLVDHCAVSPWRLRWCGATG